MTSVVRIILLIISCLNVLYKTWINSLPLCQHKLALCGGPAVCRTTWKTWLVSIFDSLMIMPLWSLTCATILMAILQKNQYRGKLEARVKKVLAEAYSRQHGWAPMMARLPNWLFLDWDHCWAITCWEVCCSVVLSELPLFQGIRRTRILKQILTE
jgi:hypothetical protein